MNLAGLATHVRLSRMWVAAFAMLAIALLTPSSVPSFVCPILSLGAAVTSCAN